MNSGTHMSVRILFCWWHAHDDVIKWKRFPRYWPIVRGLHRSGEFPAQWPVTRSFDVYFHLRLNKRLSRQLWGWWFERPPWSLWRQCNVPIMPWQPVKYITNIWSKDINQMQKRRWSVVKWVYENKQSCMSALFNLIIHFVHFVFHI